MLVPLNMFKPSFIFLLTVLCIVSIVDLFMFRVYLLICCLVCLQPYGRPLEKRVYLLAVLRVMILSLSHMVSRVRCGTGFNDSWTLSSSVLLYCGLPFMHHRYSVLERWIAF